MVGVISTTEDGLTMQGSLQVGEDNPYSQVCKIHIYAVYLVSVIAKKEAEMSSMQSWSTKSPKMIIYLSQGKPLAAEITG